MSRFWEDPEEAGPNDPQRMDSDGSHLVRSRRLYSVVSVLAMAIGWFIVDRTSIEAMETIEDRRAVWSAYHVLAERVGGLGELSGAERKREQAAVEKNYSQLIRLWRAACPAPGFEPVWLNEASGRYLTLGSVVVAGVEQ